MSRESYKGVFVEWIEEWSQFFEPCNWRTFHLTQIELEDDRIMGGIEATLIIFGIGFRVRWNYQTTDQVADIQEKIRAIEDDEISLENLPEIKL